MTSKAHTAKTRTRLSANCFSFDLLRLLLAIVQNDKANSLSLDLHAGGYPRNEAIPGQLSGLSSQIPAKFPSTEALAMGSQVELLHPQLVSCRASGESPAPSECFVRTLGQ